MRYNSTMKKVIFSGIQPSAQAPHIGNYLGALRQWVDLQKDYQAYYCVVDLHAITVPQEKKKLNDSIYATYAMLLAIGLDPNMSNIFVQSHVRQHTELTWILNCFTHMGELNRMTQFKEKSAKQTQIVSVGLYDYPVLMAVDILLYHTNIIPVGEDQVQHIELARDIAGRFNNAYGQVFTLPIPRLIKETARVMSLSDPKSKMSKSDINQNATVFLTDKPDTIRKKIMSAVTDSKKTIEFDKKRLGLYNLLEMYKAVTKKGEAEIEKHFSGKGYKEFKNELAEELIELMKPLQQKYAMYIVDKTTLEIYMRQNAHKAAIVAEQTVSRVKEKLGFIV